MEIQYKNFVDNNRVDKNLRLVMEIIGLNYDAFTINESMIIVSRILSYVVHDYHTLDLGGGDLGKSHMHNKVFDRRQLATTYTAATFFASSKGEVGYINSDNDCVVVDEVARCEFNSQDNSYGLLKNYMAGDPVKRGTTVDIDMSNRTSICFIGNLTDDILLKLQEKPEKYLNEYYDSLKSSTKEFFQEVPIRERIINIPSWECRKLNKRFYLQESRVSKEDFSSYIASIRGSYFEILPPNHLGNREDQKYKKIVSGFLKLLYPENYSEEHLAELGAYAEYIVNIGLGKYTCFHDSIEGKKLVLRLVLGHLPDNAKIESVYFEQNRVIFKTALKDSYTKIAININGIDDNKNEFSSIKDSEKVRISSSEIIMESQNLFYTSKIEELEDLNFLKDTGMIMDPVEKIKIELKEEREARKKLEEKIALIVKKNDDIIKLFIDFTIGVPYKTPEFLQKDIKKLIL